MSKFVKVNDVKGRVCVINIENINYIGEFMNELYIFMNGKNSIEISQEEYDKLVEYLLNGKPKFTRNGERIV